jgi:hypothetical protein
MRSSNRKYNHTMNMIRPITASIIIRIPNHDLPLQGLSTPYILRQAQDNKEKIQALLLAKDCYSMKLDLLTNATVVDDAIRFVSSNKPKENLTSSSSNSNEGDKEVSEEPDYDEDKDQVEEKQEEETEGITSATINKVFDKD